MSNLLLNSISARYNEQEYIPGLIPLSGTNSKSELPAPTLKVPKNKAFDRAHRHQFISVAAFGQPVLRGGAAGGNTICRRLDISGR